MSRISALLSVIVIALILAPAPALASSGFRSDFDFPGHGDDWYGRFLPDSRRDFPANPLDLASDGDDFGRGYEILVARSRFGPPLALTNGSGHEYLFRYGDRQADPQECFVDTNCGDSIFCNGAEICTNHSCGPGSPPACSDGNACTDDFCDTVADACDFAPLTDPGEVLNLNLEILAASTIARLTWNAQAAASEYNVYRSEAIDLENLACYQVTPMNILDDVGEIPVSGLFEFLVTSFGCGGESTLGVPTSGVEREPAAGCP